MNSTRAGNLIHATGARVAMGLVLAVLFAACATNQDPLRLAGVPPTIPPGPTSTHVPVVPTPTPEPDYVSFDDIGPEPGEVQTRIGNLSVSARRATVGDQFTVTFTANGGTGWLCGGERQVPGGHPGVSLSLSVQAPPGRAISGTVPELVSYTPETLSREGASVSPGGAGVSWNAGPANPKPANCTSGDTSGHGSPTGLFGDGQAFTATFEVTKPINAWIVVRANTGNEQGGAYAVVPVLVTTKNVAPAAVIVAEQSGGPFRYEFDGSGSLDLDGEVEEYHWDFGDGESAEGEQVTHQFTSPGKHRVQLTVIDDLDDEGAGTQIIDLSRVSVAEGRMTDASVFTVVVNVDLHDGSKRELDVAVDMLSGFDEEPIATLERTLGDEDLAGLTAGQSQVRIEFDLEEEEVPRFVDRITTNTTVTLRESLSDGREIMPEEATSDDEIPLPVVITHGIMGDVAHLLYESVGPGMDTLAKALAEDGYRESAAYPTLTQLTYPSLHFGGIEYLASSYMKPAVEDVLENTYADKIDIVAHSMGGLVSRAYLELLGGGQHVRKLVTLGTPHEGAAKAHGTLAGIEPTSDQPGLVEALKDFAGRAGEVLQAIGAVLIGAAADWSPGIESKIVDWLLIQEPAEIGMTTTIQLLPDYPYYNEVDRNGTRRGTGYPDDPGMDLQQGQMGLLGNNDFLHALNTGGFADGVEYFQIYRAGHDTRLEVIRYEATTGDGAYEWVKGPGDATVPLRSATLADYPALSAQLWKCNVPGGEHYLMMGHFNTGLQVRTILLLPAGRDSIEGCSR